MPDISMCDNASCVMRNECLRYLALPSMLQSFCHFMPDPPDQGCEYFIQVRKDDVLKEPKIDWKNSP